MAGDACGVFIEGAVGRREELGVWLSSSQSNAESIINFWVKFRSSIDPVKVATLHKSRF